MTFETSSKEVGMDVGSFLRRIRAIGARLAGGLVHQPAPVPVPVRVRRGR